MAMPIYIYLNNMMVKNTSENIKQMVLNISLKLDDFVGVSNSITKQVYFNTKLMDAIQAILNNTNEISGENAYTKISNDIFMISATNPNLRRITIFDSRGDIFSNKPNDIRVSEAYQDQILEFVRRKHGSSEIFYSSKDRWLMNDKAPVYSFIRQLRSGEYEYGFLEIQVNAADLIIPPSSSSYKNGKLYVFNDTGILYPFGDQDRVNIKKIEYYKKMLLPKKSGEMDIKVENGEKEHIIYIYSDLTGFYIVYSVPHFEMYASLRVIRNITVIVFILIIGVSLLVYYILLRVLTRPLRELRKALNSDDILNNTITVKNFDNNDEIELLNRSFEDMKKKLKNTMEEIVKAKTLQLKTHFDVLQAQMNPHFIFNVLGIISILCDNKRDREAAEICRKLASFLRYTISTSQDVCSMSKEINFTREYLELMKYRYAHRLNFEINVDETILEVDIPKLSLQPLVENCIVHAFKDTDGVMNIFITGSKKDLRWEVTIIDNGSGFSGDTLYNIKQKIENYRVDMDTNFISDNPSTPGMGIVNTFARLKLLHKDELNFDFGNNSRTTGAFITISGILNIEDEK